MADENNNKINDYLTIAIPYKVGDYYHSKIAKSGKLLSVFHTNANDHIFRLITATRDFYESELLSELAAYLHPDDLVIDIGANIGNHTLYFSSICKCNVISFEPNPPAVDILVKNIIANNLSDRVTIFNCGLGEHDGKIVAAPDNDINNLGSTHFSIGSDDGICLKRLDDFKFASAVKLIKIDVEGMEIDVLRGASETLRASNAVLCIECDEVHMFDEIFKYLKQFGYTPLISRNYTATHIFIKNMTENEKLDIISAEIAKRYISVNDELHKLQKYCSILEERLNKSGL